MAVHTLEELFVGIFFKECFVDNGASQVVHHQVNNGLNLVFCVSGIIGKGVVLDHVRKLE